MLTFFVSAGKSVISAAAGTPGLKEEKDKAKKKKLVYFQLYLYLSNVGLQLLRACQRLSFLKAYLVFNEDMLCNKLSNYKQDYVIRN